MTNKKAQILSEVIKYSLVLIVAVLIVVIGYKAVNLVKEKICNTEIAKFEIEMKGIDKSLRFGARQSQSYDAPCNAEQIYFFGFGKSTSPENFKAIPIIKDALESRSGNNVFIIKNGDVKRSFYAGQLEIDYPYYKCFSPKFGKISFFAEGAGNSAKIIGSCDQPDCTLIPIGISDAETRKVMQDLIGACSNCPSALDSDMDNKIQLTRQSVDMFRSFDSCDGTTNIKIIIRPKSNAAINNFNFYEIIPKDCVDDLNKQLVGNINDALEIKSDPIVVWHFDEIKSEKIISYKLNMELSNECKEVIEGMGIIG